MPATPELWIDPINVNTETADDQDDAVVVHLTSGYILVAWTSDNDTGAGAAVGTDIIGQLYNERGEPVGGEFRINGGWNADDEANVSIDALPNGGFVAVYSDTDETNSADASLRYTTWDVDASGNPNVALSSGTIIADSNASGVPNFADAQISVGSATSAMVVYEQANAGDTDIYGVILHPGTNAVGTPFVISNEPNNAQTDPQVTVLGNGNYVVTWTDQFSTDSDFDVSYAIYDSAGAVVKSKAFVAGANNGGNFVESSSSVTSLDGGGFVVAWKEEFDPGNGTNTTEIRYTLYDAAGTVVLGNQLVEALNNVGSFFSAELRNPAVTALNDGGFMIGWQDVIPFVDSPGVELARYDSTGNVVGDRIEIFNGFESDLALTTLADGRVAVSFTSTVAGDDNVKMYIYDPRDEGSSSNLDWIGTRGDDTVFETTNIVQNMYLWDGDDTLTITNDAVGETFDGGEGFNTLRLLAGPADRIVDLSTNTYEEANGDTDTVLNFQQVIAGSGDDTLTGVDLGSYWSTATRSNAENANFLRGGEGDDTISSNGADGEFEGGAGADTLNGTGLLFSFLSYAGSDAAVSVNLDSQTAAGGHADGDVLTNWASVRGSAFDDVLTGSIGNNAIEGGAGADTIDGGSGFDLATYFTASSGVRADLRGTLAGTGDAAGDTFTSIDGIMGSLFSDQLYAEGLNLYGNAGDDFLFGTDMTNAFGGDGYDRVTLLDSSTAGAVINLGAQNVELVRGTDFDDDLDASTVTADDLIDQNGNTQPVRLFGNNGDDTLTGSDFFDFISGGRGDDTINGNGGNDIIDGLQGADTLNGGDGDDRFFVDNEDFINGGAGFDQIFVRGYADNGLYELSGSRIEFANGNIANDAFIAAGANYSVKLFGQRGNDFLAGGGEGDQLFGGQDDDVLIGNGGNDLLNGGSGADRLEGGDGDDRLITQDAATIEIGSRLVADVTGDAGFDRLYLQGSLDNPVYDLTHGQIEFASGNSGNNTFDATNASFAVKLLGRSGDDALTGGFGQDLIYGGTGNDTIEGAQGDDRLYGEGGDDTFVYSATGWGDDVIVGFEDGNDLIDMSGLGIDFSDLSFTFVSGQTTLVEFGGDSILVLGINIGDLDAADFVF